MARAGKQKRREPDQDSHAGSRRQERAHPGGDPGDPGSAPAPDEEEHGRTKAERARKREGGTLEDGSEVPD
jgi:hypothetical protein